MQGVAEITFRRREDAERAVEEFNGREFEKRIIRVRIVEPRGAAPAAPAAVSAPVFAVTLSSPPKQQRKPKPAPKPQRKAAEPVDLDAMLDRYRSGK